MSNRAGGDASLTARIQILNEGIENLTKMVQELQRLKVEFQAGAAASERFDASTKAVGRGTSDALAQMTASLTGVTNNANQANRSVSILASSTANYGREIKALTPAQSQFNSMLDQTTKSTTSFKESITAVGQGLQSSISAYSAAAISVFGLYNAYDNLEKVQQRSDRSALALEKAQTRLNAITTTYNIQLQKGNLTAEQAAVAQERIANAEGQVEVASKQAEIAAGDLNETMVGFASQVLPFVATAALNVVNMIVTIRASLLGQAQAAGVATTANVGLAASLKAVMLANPPLTAALIVISGLVLAISTNFLGLRDAINSFGEAVGRAIPILKPFLEFIGSLNKLFGEAETGAKSAATGINDSFSSMESSVGSSIDGINIGIGSIKTNLSKGFDAALSTLKIVLDKIDKDMGNVTFHVTADLDKQKLDDIRTEAEAVLGDGIDIKVYLPEANRVISDVDKLGDGIDHLLNKAAQGKNLLGIFNTALKENTFSLEEITQAFNGAGDIMTTINGTLVLTEGQLDIIKNKLGATEDQWKSIRAELEKMAIIDPTKFIPIDGNMIDHVASKSKLLKGTIQTVKDEFAKAIGVFFGATSSLTDLDVALLTVKESLNQAGYSIEQVTEIMKYLNDIVATKTVEAGEKAIDFNSKMAQIVRTGGDVRSAVNTLGLGFTDITSKLDVAGTKVDNSRETLKKWASSGEVSSEEVQKAFLNMANGVFVATESMDQEQIESMKIIQQWYNSLSDTQKAAVLADLIANDIIPTIGDMDAKLEESMVTLTQFNKKFDEVSKVQKDAGVLFEQIWNNNKEMIQNVADPEVFDQLIATFEELADMEGLDPAMKESLLQYIEALKFYKGVLESTIDPQRNLTVQVINHANAVGIDKDRLNELNEIKRNNISLSNEELIAIQEEINAHLLLNDILVSSEELELRRAQSYGNTIEGLKELQFTIQEQIGTQQALEASLPDLMEHYNTTWPAGLAVTYENILMVIGAAEGLESAQKKLEKSLIDLAGGLNAFQQSELETTNAIEANARALGVSSDLLARYNASKNAAGIAERQHQTALINATQAQINSGRANQFTALTVQQMVVASQSADVRYNQFMQNMQVESIESARYAQLLINRLIQLGMAANQARKLVASSLQAGEQAIRHLSGVFGAEMPDLNKGSGGGGGGGGGGSQKQKIDKKALREQAAQDAIDEAGAVDHLVNKLIDETEQIHKLALATGIGKTQMEEYADATNKFGIATDKARIEMLELIEAEAKQLKFLTSSTETYKDYIRANIDGITRANDFTREVRRNAASLEAQREQLFQITRVLGISLPASIQPTLKNLQYLIEASYGSQEAFDALTKTASAAGEFYKDIIGEAKKAIEDAEFEEFVKKELLFENVGDEFFRNVSRELQAEMKLDKISAQMSKQLGLIQLNPKMFQMDVSEAEIRTGVQNTITAIETEIAGNERLTAAWQPILDNLYTVLQSPDIHSAIQGFAQIFPDIIEPSILGVNTALEGLDTTIDQTFSDDTTETIDATTASVDNLEKTSEKLYKQLLKDAKAAQDFSDSMGGGGGGSGGFGGAINDALPKVLEFDSSLQRVPPSLGQIISATEVMAGIVPAEIATLPEASRPSWTQMQIDAIATMAAMGKSFSDLPPELQAVAKTLPPPIKEALGIIETDSSETTGVVIDEFGNIVPAVGETGQQAGKVWDDHLGMFVDVTKTAVDDSKGELPPFVDEAGKTGTDAVTSYETELAAAKEKTTAIVTEMGTRFYALAEFVANNFNPNFATIVDLGFQALPPIVDAQVLLMQTNYDKLQTTIPASTQTTVDLVKPILDQNAANTDLMVNMMVLYYETGMMKIQVQTQTTINDITTRLGTLGPVTKGVMDLMSKEWDAGTKQWQQLVQTGVNNITNSLGTLIQVMANILQRMADNVGQFVSEAAKAFKALADDAVKKWDEMAKASEKAADRATKAVKSIPTYHLTIHEIRTVHTGGGGKAAEGTTQIISKETHFTAGEAGRPEIVSIIPLKSDIFDKTGQADKSLNIQASSDKVLETISPGPSNMSNPAAMVTRSAAELGSSGGGTRTINLNINQPIIVNDREIGRNIVTRTFDDIDNQT